MQKRSRQTGFTLFEVIMTTLLLGVLAYISAPALSTLGAVKSSGKIDEQTAINKKIGQALLDWSAGQGTNKTFSSYTTIGTLPNRCDSTPLPYALVSDISTTPYSCGKNSSGSTNVAAYLAARGVTTALAVSDGTASQNRRVYQKLGASGLGLTGTEENANMSVKVGLFNGGPPSVFLQYEAAVIYSTNCPAVTCNAANLLVPTTQKFSKEVDGVTGYTIPATTWAPVAYDTTKPSSDIANLRAGYGLAYVSTLPLQKQLLAQTATTINNLITAFRTYAAATGRYPFSTLMNDNTTSARDSAVGATGTGLVGNDNCWTSWTSLNNVAPSSTRELGATILAKIGINGSVVPMTAWNGAIDYCANYDPATSKAAINDTLAPSYAALRLNQNVGQGQSSSTASTSSIFISF